MSSGGHQHTLKYSLVSLTMVVVAIAGGSGGVGRTILDAIAESGEHNAMVFSRTVSLARSFDSIVLKPCYSGRYQGAKTFRSRLRKYRADEAYFSGE